jgi:hypothetical protein
MARTTHLISQSPQGWTNVVPALGQQYLPTINTCTGLIQNSTQISLINSTISATDYDRNIRRLRAALWLRSSDSQVAIAFNVLEGPTDNYPGRCPKFCICVGISLQVYNNLSSPFTTQDPTYQSIRQAAIYFSNNNQDQPSGSDYRGRLYVLVAQNNQPLNGDYVYPIFQCATHNDTAIKEGSTAAEGSQGVLESYSGSGTRWPSSVTSWKLKRWQDA